MNLLNRAVMDRRTVLRAGGVALGLPLLDAMVPTAWGSRRPAPAPRRMVLVHRPLGTYHPYLVPATPGPRHETTRFLKPMEPFRGRFTLFSGMAHPGYPNAHGTEPAIFTGVPGLDVRDLHNSVSLDQVAARAVGRETRLPYLLLKKVWSQSLSWNEKGVPIPHENSPSAVFRRMFVEGTPEEVRREERRLAQGRSILDGLRGDLKALERRVGTADRARIDVLTHSIREAEQQLEQEAYWSTKPKPVPAVPLKEIQKRTDTWVASQEVWFTLIHLALQTDSTRVVVFGAGEHGRSNLPGLDIGHHDASHHGKDPDKIEQLSRFEDHEFATYARFLGRLKDSAEGEATLLDRTQTLFTSNLGDASAHSSRNLPVLLAGGGYRHRGHVAYDTANERPLCDLYVRMLRQLSVEADRFGSSAGVVTELG